MLAGAIVQARVEAEVGQDLLPLAQLLGHDVVDLVLAAWDVAD